MCCLILIYIELFMNTTMCKVRGNCTLFHFKFSQGLFTISDITSPVVTNGIGGAIQLTYTHLCLPLPSHGDSTCLEQASRYVIMSSSVGGLMYLYIDAILIYYKLPLLCSFYKPFLFLFCIRVRRAYWFFFNDILSLNSLLVY